MNELENALGGYNRMTNEQLAKRREEVAEARERVETAHARTEEVRRLFDAAIAEEQSALRAYHEIGNRWIEEA